MLKLALAGVSIVTYTCICGSIEMGFVLHCLFPVVSCHYETEEEIHPAVIQ